MKKINIIYWIVTGIFGAFMLFSGIMNAMVDAGSIALIKTTLGYPHYIIAFLGVAKILGVIGILVPGYPRVTEWAYAGLFFDLVGATYSGIAVEGFNAGTPFMLVFFAFEALSYIYYHKRLAAKGEPAMAGA